MKGHATDDWFYDLHPDDQALQWAWYELYHANEAYGKPKEDNHQQNQTTVSKLPRKDPPWKKK